MTHEVHHGHGGLDALGAHAGGGHSHRCERGRQTHRNAEEAIDAVNEIASEHLEIVTREPFLTMTKIRNAGAIFIGPWSSEPLGDYVAGPNHTLPTGGTARFSNPLGVYDFQKRSSVIYYTPEGLAADAPSVQALAQAEGLWAHALSVGMRRKLVEQSAETFSDPVAACDDALHTAWPRPLDEPGVPKLSGGEA